MVEHYTIGGKVKLKRKLTWVAGRVKNGDKGERIGDLWVPKKSLVRSMLLILGWTFAPIIYLGLYKSDLMRSAQLDFFCV